ncbi:MAG: hypothetical protein ACOYXM_18975 [Actinomycetota bacterium]
MRLLQLVTGPQEILDLHPHVSVVTGLDEDSRTALVEAVAGLARAEAVGQGGLLEAHGVLFDLDPVLLSVIESAPDTIDPIVQPGQLPTQPVSVDARELRSREQSFAQLLERITGQAERQSVARDAVAAASSALDAARRARADADSSASSRAAELERLAGRLDELQDLRRKLSDEAGDLRHALASARGAREEVERRTAKEREATDAAVALRSAIEAELAEIDSTVELTSTDEVDRAAEALQELEAVIAQERAHEAERAQAPAPEPVPDVEAAPQEPAEDRLERLDARLRELEHLLVVVTAVERAEIEEAVELLQGGETADRVPSPQAHAIADELDQISAELNASAAHELPEVPPAVISDARSRLDDARQALLEAEQAVRSRELDRDDVLLLEDTHSELVEVMDKASSRFGGGRAANRLAELRSAEEAVLERLGFASYADYMMGYSLFVVDPAKEQALDEARAALAAAEDEWRAMQRDVDAALARAALLDRRRSLLTQARELLGRVMDGGEPQAELRALRVPATSTVESAKRLRSSLEAVGMELGDEQLDHDELLLLAESWLREADLVDGRRRAALDEQSALRQERAELVQQIEDERLAASAPEPVPEELPLTAEDREELRVQRLAAARDALAAAQARHAASQAAAARRSALLEDLETAREMERSASLASAGAAAEVSAAVEAEAALAARLRAVDDDDARAAREIAEAERSLESLTGPPPDVSSLESALQAAEARHQEAMAQLEVEDLALEALDAEGREAALEIERLQDIVAAQGTGSATPAEELEWYLLARLASQRSVSVAGSVPLLLDEALRGLQADELDHLLGRLERMAEAVQVIVISEDPVVAAWAEGAGPARAAVVRPSAA